MEFFFETTPYKGRVKKVDASTFCSDPPTHLAKVDKYKNKCILDVIISKCFAMCLTLVHCLFNGYSMCIQCLLNVQQMCILGALNVQMCIQLLTDDL